ncbi:hypothetical protein GWN26_02345 [Candidatus Saccharibacteria bacterium]|nr:hypothetical protein [Candidatus Saccharibacteria bacterium]NIV71487.1 hypothetical protein [Calditrichia bacterium]NIV98041.1 hypothetical protein [Candidatus Saccharibacteria bacterium]NIW78339.1 hypothetical protein [Calditrichia bacterium]
MVFLDVLFAFIIAVVLSGIFVLIIRRYGPWPRSFMFFIIIFLAAWAGGVWMNPVGPTIKGSTWMPFLFVGLIFALLLAATSQRQEESSIILKTKEEVKKEERVKTALSIYFWLLILALVAAIVLGYLFMYNVM